MYTFQISNHLSFMYQNVEISFHYAVAKILLRETRNCVTMNGVNPNAAEISGPCLFNYPDDTYIGNIGQPQRIVTETKDVKELSSLTSLQKRKGSNKILNKKRKRRKYFLRRKPH